MENVIVFANFKKVVHYPTHSAHVEVIIITRGANLSTYLSNGCPTFIRDKIGIAVLPYFNQSKIHEETFFSPTLCGRGGRDTNN